MKKLLSLLSVLTVSGTAIPTTIAASPYQKEKTINSEINYSQTNNLENLNKHRSKRDYDFLSKKIVITATNGIESDGIVFNNKLYFGSLDGKVYEYDPATEQQKVVITTGGPIYKASGVIFNNKLYFSSDDSKVYEYTTTGHSRVVLTANESIWTDGIVFNNKLYFGSEDDKVYEYNPETGHKKVVIKTNGNIYSSGVVFNNKLYFGSHDGKVYEFIDFINDNANVNISKNIKLENNLNYSNNIDITSLVRRIEKLEKFHEKDINNAIVNPEKPNSNCTNGNIDINELSNFVNNVLNKNIKELGKSIQNDKDTNMLQSFEADVLSEIKQAGKNIENIVLDINNVEIFMEELSSNMVNIANSLRKITSVLVHTFADIDGLARGSEVQGMVFKKIKEIILNFKNNEKDLFKENIQYLGNNIIEIGEKISKNNSQPLGNKIQQIGEELRKSNLDDEEILENIGNKIENFGSSLKELSEILPKGKETTNRTGFVVENIGFFIKKFIKNNNCVNDNISIKIESKPEKNINSCIAIESNMEEKNKEITELKKQLEIANKNIKELEERLVKANNKIENFKKYLNLMNNIFLWE